MVNGQPQDEDDDYTYYTNICRAVLTVTILIWSIIMAIGYTITR